MSAFATTDDLASYIGGETPLDVERGQLMLDIASEEIRNYTNQTLDLVDPDAFTVIGNGLVRLPLPELPVVSVTSVVEDGVTLVEGTDYQLETAGQLVRLPANPWWSPFVMLGWPGQVWPLAKAIVVTYAHGYSPIPNDVRGICLRTAARAYRNPDAAVEQSITNYAIQYGRQPNSAAPLSVSDQLLLDRYRIDM